MIANAVLENASTSAWSWESRRLVLVDPGASYRVRFPERRRVSTPTTTSAPTRSIAVDPRVLAPSHSLSSGDNYLDTHRQRAEHDRGEHNPTVGSVEMHGRPRCQQKQWRDSAEPPRRSCRADRLGNSDRYQHGPKQNKRSPPVGVRADRCQALEQPPRRQGAQPQTHERRTARR